MSGNSKNSNEQCSCNDTSQSNQTNKSNRNDDLKHGDWLLFSIVENIKINYPNIVTKITNKKKYKGLTISQVSESDIKNLSFFTNTDKNNNYLNLESFNVYLDNNVAPSLIPGLKIVAKDMWKHYDAVSFVNNSKTFIPFPNISSFLDNYTTAIPFVPQTVNHIKIYKLHLRVNNYN
jgi:hypothetical protein